MALGFFRRHQKMVLVIMVLLMVAFLIPASIRGVFEGKPHRHVIGYAGEEKITLGMQWSADADIKLLSRRLGLGQGQGRREGEMVFAMFLRANEERQSALAWSLLLHEARQLGIRVTTGDIDEFLAASGLSGSAYRQALANLSLGGLTEKDLRRAIASHLLIARAFSAAQVNTPPSLPEIRAAYRDLRERIQLAMAVFQAEDFLDKTAPPTEAEIRQWFAARKHLLPRSRTNRTPFGFGYRQPDRVDLAWLFVDQERIEQAIDVPASVMRTYWLRNKGELTKEVPLPPTGTSPADTQPAEPKTRTVVITRYAEAKPIIRERLKGQVAEQKAVDLVTRLRELLRQHADAKDPYGKVAAAVTAPAAALLGKRVEAMPFTSAPLGTVIEQLERITGVKIAYPYGENQTLSVDPKVVVSLGKFKSTLTLGEVLEKVRIALKHPRIRWATCEGLDGAIFPAEPVSLMPFSSGTTGMIDFGDLTGDELLGWSRTAPGGGDSLAQVVATAAVFQGPVRRHTPLIEVGSDFRQAMYVSDPRRGRLLWRLLAARAEHDPQNLTPDIRRQVLEDMKLFRGFQAALEVARKMLADVKSGKDLEKLAEQQKSKFVKTDPFPRMRMYYMRPGPTSVPEVGVSPAFLQRAFALAPKDPDDRTTPGPADLVPLERARKITVIQRIGYDPPTEEEFRENGLYLAVPLLMQQRFQRAMVAWLLPQSIIDRVGYSPRVPEG